MKDIPTGSMFWTCGGPRDAIIGKRRRATCRDASNRHNLCRSSCAGLVTMTTAMITRSVTSRYAKLCLAVSAKVRGLWPVLVRGTARIMQPTMQ